MTSRDFCYWLQGYIEIAKAHPDPAAIALSGAQVECIQRHLALVFKHEIDPSFADSAALNEAHKPPFRPPSSPIGGVVARC